MLDEPSPDADLTDPAAIGLSLLLADTEAAIASAQAEISMLTKLAGARREHGPYVSPPAPGLSNVSAAPDNADANDQSPGQQARSLAGAEPASPVLAPIPVQRQELDRREPGQTTVAARSDQPVAPEAAKPLPLATATPTAAVPQRWQEGAVALAPNPRWVGPPPNQQSPSSNHVTVEGLSSSRASEVPFATSAAVQKARVQTTPVQTGEAVRSNDRREPLVAEGPIAPIQPLRAQSTQPTDGTSAGRADFMPVVTPERLEPARESWEVPRPAQQTGGDSGSGQPGVPLRGDVYLEGVRVGRWMADYLTREVGGPARGSTMFDPLLGPRWPGSLQGH